MIKSLFWRTANVVAPKRAAEYYGLRRRREAAAMFVEKLCSTDCLSDRIKMVHESVDHYSCQKATEIREVLVRLQQMQPRFLCEIGVDRGGTLALFASVAHPEATLISIDIYYPREKHYCFGGLSQPKQRLFCLEADTHNPATIKQLRRRLGSHELDFLFVDGDHSYDGVKADYQMYRGLVRSGGLIGFHDIVPDFKTRYGTPTTNDVGEVPRFWAEISQGNSTVEEFVDDREQDGFGIGVIRGL